MIGQQAVPLAPIPTNWAIDSATVGGKQFIAVTISDPSGNKVHWMEPEFAKEVAGLLLALANQASSGLILPPGVISPNGHQHGEHQG